MRKLLKEKQTTRAIALLVNPAIDFKETPGSKPDFASFCLLQLIRRDLNGVSFADCVGYYRAQEMVKWWPIYVAELLELQTSVAKRRAATVHSFVLCITLQSDRWVHPVFRDVQDSRFKPKAVAPS